MSGGIEQIGLIGGTFNPVHHGHLIAARAARENLGLDRLLLIPNVRSPLRMEEVLADPQDRLAMVRLAVEHEPGLEACDVEVRRRGTSFLVETLRELREDFPDAELTFLMGVDSLDTFDRWREVEKIVQLARVTVMPRPGREATAALSDLERRTPALKGKLHCIPAGPRMEISATGIRRRIAAGQSVRYLVPDAVADYIRRHRMYS